jgi:DNA-directed RNA polymerase subunit RPC12/RpoP
MIAEASAAFGSIKVAMDMAKGIGALKSEAEINKAIINIQQALLEAQSAALTDKETITQLRDQVRRLEVEVNAKQDWSKTAGRYKLSGNEMGSFVYELAPDVTNLEPFHRLCVTCFESERKSILHGRDVLTCNNCGSKIRVEPHHSTVSFSR